MSQKLIYNQKLYHSDEFSSLEEFENMIFKNAEYIFGQSTIILSFLTSENDMVVDSSGLVMDFSDPINPRSSMLKVSLFTTPALTIFQQTVKLFRLIHFPTDKLLIKNLLPSFTLDSLRKKAAEKTGIDNVEHLINKATGNCKSILLIMDGENRELMEIDDKYPDTWQTLVDVMYVKKYSYLNDTIISVSRNLKNRDVQFVLDNL